MAQAEKNMAGISLYLLVADKTAYRQILNILIAFSVEILSLQLNVGTFPEKINSCIRLIFLFCGKEHFTCDHLFKTLLLR